MLYYVGDWHKVLYEAGAINLVLYPAQKSLGTPLGLRPRDAPRDFFGRDITLGIMDRLHNILS